LVKSNALLLQVWLLRINRLILKAQVRIRGEKNHPLFFEFFNFFKLLITEAKSKKPRQKISENPK